MLGWWDALGCACLRYEGLSIRDRIRGPCRSRKQLRGLQGLGPQPQCRGSFCSLLPPTFAHLHSLAAACRASLFTDSPQMVTVKKTCHRDLAIQTWIFLIRIDKLVMFKKKLEVGTLCANTPEPISIWTSVYRNQRALAGKDRILGREGERGDKEAPAAPLSSSVRGDGGGSSSSKGLGLCSSMRWLSPLGAGCRPSPGYLGLLVFNGKGIPPSAARIGAFGEPSHHRRFVIQSGELPACGYPWEHLRESQSIRAVILLEN